MRVAMFGVQRIDLHAAYRIAREIAMRGVMRIEMMVMRHGIS